LPNDPNAANHDQDPGYAEGLGRQHVDVLIPSFIAAYTGEDPELVNLNLTEQISSRSFIPKPNWQLRYNGLTKLPWFKDLFSNVSITHGYTSSLAVNNYQTDLQYDPLEPYFIDQNISTGNYFARFEIPEVVIEERFQPIIGIDFKTKSNLTANFEFVKSRSLQLSTGLGQINETKSTEYTAGLGWIFDDVNIAFLTGQRKSRSRRSRRNDTEEAPIPSENDNDADPRNEAANFQKKLQFNFDFGLRDDATYTHEFDSGRDAQATRGTYSLQVSPSLDYDINKYFTLRMFVDYNQTKPKTLGGYDVTNVNGGITARFNLQ
jgi:cell surface protein SprA